MYWDASTKGRQTRRLIVNLESWSKKKHGVLNYHFTPALTWHSCFGTHLHRIGKEATSVATVPRTNSTTPPTFSSTAQHRHRKEETYKKLLAKIIYRWRACHIHTERYRIVVSMSAIHIVRDFCQGTGRANEKKYLKTWTKVF